ncbi:DNA translocase FtsK 4TM domain-containing protein [Candidatus Saccharibacteria bacterium]|nr:DNA translocase FtsK 4TM domain-containing protein [Candidatus Saccharibacteria bacterium]
MVRKKHKKKPAKLQKGKKLNKKEQQEKAEAQAELKRSIVREIVAIILIALAVFLLLASFGLAATAGAWILGAIKVVIGLSAYVLPLTLLLTAWVLFLPEKYQLRGYNILGQMAFYVFLSSIFAFIFKSNSPDITVLANQGGLVGYGLYALMSPVLNQWVAIFILSALLTISIVIAANARLKDIIIKTLSLFGLRRKDGEDGNEETEPKFQINTKLPIKGTIGNEDQDQPKEKEEALTGALDKDWKYPSLDLLEEGGSKADAGDVKANAKLIQDTLAHFGIDVSMADVNIGPTVAQYSLKPPTGVKLNKITTLDRDLALALAQHPIRIEAPIPGKSLVGIEVPNKKVAMVRLRDILASKDMDQYKSRLDFVLGRDVSGEIVVADLNKMPHLLIAGATGAGKSVTISALIASLLYRNSPSELKLILVDPKRVEMTPYNDIPHLLTPVITEPDKTISSLKWAVAEMERRYKLFSETANKNISEYNSSNREDAMPFIVILIDELADLMMVAAKEVEGLIVRLAQMGRAAGMHLVLATQRPDVNVITGIIKANIPSRIALRTASQIDSRTILDQAGAEKLIGNGDMLFVNAELTKPKRIQGVYIANKETENLAKFLREQRAAEYNEEVTAQAVKMPGSPGSLESADDDMFEQAAEVVIQNSKASASLLQRRLRVGYARAARLIDLLEERGVVGPPDGARPREVLVSDISDLMGGSLGGGEEQPK